MEPILLAFLRDHPDDSVGVLYHSGFPGPGDPFYQHNIADNDGRIADYGVIGVPEERADGVLEPIFLYTYERIQAVYDARKATPTDVTLSAGGSYDPGSGEVQITVTADVPSPLPPGDYRLHIVLTESGIDYDASNGIDVHDHTMRRMLPDHGGTPVDLTGPLPVQVEASALFGLDPSYAPDRCHLVYFLQEAAGREVHQAGSLLVTDLPEPSDVATASWSSLKASYR